MCSAEWTACRRLQSSCSVDYSHPQNRLHCSNPYSEYYLYSKHSYINKALKLFCTICVVNLLYRSCKRRTIVRYRYHTVPYGTVPVRHCIKYSVPYGTVPYCEWYIVPYRTVSVVSPVIRSFITVNGHGYYRTVPYGTLPHRTV